MLSNLIIQVIHVETFKNLKFCDFWFILLKFKHNLEDILQPSNILRILSKFYNLFRCHIVPEQFFQQKYVMGILLEVKIYSAWSSFV